MIKQCNNELFVYEERTYYSCQLKKGHRGKHKHTSITLWNTGD